MSEKQIFLTLSCSLALYTFFAVSPGTVRSTACSGSPEAVASACHCYCCEYSSTSFSDALEKRRLYNPFWVGSGDGDCPGIWMLCQKPVVPLSLSLMVMRIYMPQKVQLQLVAPPLAWMLLSTLGTVFKDDPRGTCGLVEQTFVFRHWDFEIPQ